MDACDNFIANNAQKNNQKWSVLGRCRLVCYHGIRGMARCNKLLVVRSLLYARTGETL